MPLTLKTKPDYINLTNTYNRPPLNSNNYKTTW